MEVIINVWLKNMSGTGEKFVCHKKSELLSWESAVENYHGIYPLVFLQWEMVCAKGSRGPGIVSYDKHDDLPVPMI